LAVHQQAADELGGDDLGGASEDGLGEVLGDRGGYGSGLGRWVEGVVARRVASGIVYCYSCILQGRNNENVIYNTCRAFRMPYQSRLRTTDCRWNIC